MESPTNLLSKIADNRHYAPLLWCIMLLLPIGVLIWGENDADTPLYMGRIMEKEIPDAALVLYPGKGHYAFAEDYAKTLAILDSFFA